MFKTCCVVTVAIMPTSTGYCNYIINYNYTITMLLFTQ